MEIKESVVYRITNTKAQKVLSLVADDSASGRYRVDFAEQSKSSLQGWMFAKAGDNTYRIYPYIASNVSLTSYNQRAKLEPIKGSQNQLWQLEQRADDVCQLLVSQDKDNRNKLVSFRGKLVTQYYRDRNDDEWKIERMELRSIPELVGGDGVDLTMGPTNYEIYIKPKGTIKAVMVFVNFPDTKTRRINQNKATLDVKSAEKMAKHLLGESDQAKTIFKSQSHNKFQLEVTVKSDSGWKELTQNSSYYVGQNNIVNGWQLLNDVKSLFTENGVVTTFADYSMIFVVLPKEAIEINPGTSYGWSPSEEISNAILFGADSYRNRYVNLVHEVGHQIGLPDLYPLGDARSTLSEEFRNARVSHLVGCWSIMADMHHSESYLGWERHKMGWLDDAKKLYLPEISSSPLRVTLNPLKDSSGLSMIVIPLGSAETPSRVFVVEIGQDVYGVKKEPDGKLIRDDTVSDKKGILLYTVDAKIATGAFPVKIIPKKVSRNNQYGQLFEAPYSNNDSKTFKDDEANVEIKVTVYKNDDSTYMVDIMKKATTTIT